MAASRINEIHFTCCAFLWKVVYLRARWIRCSIRVSSCVHSCWVARLRSTAALCSGSPDDPSAWAAVINPSTSAVLSLMSSSNRSCSSRKSRAVYKSPPMSWWRLRVARPIWLNQELTCKSWKIRC